MKTQFPGFFGSRTQENSSPTTDPGPAEGRQEPAASGPPLLLPEAPLPKETLRTADFAQDPHSGPPPAPETLVLAPSKAGRMLGLTALVVSLGAAAAAGYLWQTTQKTQLRLQAELTNTKATVDATLKDWSAKLTEQKKQKVATESAPLEELRTNQDSLTKIINERLLPHVQNDTTTQTLAELKSVVADISGTLRTNFQGSVELHKHIDARLAAVEKNLSEANGDFATTRKQVRILCDVAKNQEAAIRAIEENLNPGKK